MTIRANALMDGLLTLVHYPNSPLLNRPIARWSGALLSAATEKVGQWTHAKGRIWIGGATGERAFDLI